MIISKTYLSPTKPPKKNTYFTKTKCAKSNSKKEMSVLSFQPTYPLDKLQSNSVSLFCALPSQFTPTTERVRESSVIHQKTILNPSTWTKSCSTL